MGKMLIIQRTILKENLESKLQHAVVFQFSLLIQRTILILRLRSGQEENLESKLQLDKE